MNMKKESTNPTTERIIDMFGGDLLTLVQQAVRTELKNLTPPPNDNLELPRFVTGIKSLAKVLNVSVSTVSRWKSDGLIDSATFQDGKIVPFDVYGVLDILRVSNKKGKHNNLMLNRKKKETNL